MSIMLRNQLVETIAHAVFIKLQDKSIQALKSHQKAAMHNPTAAFSERAVQGPCRLS